jgi:hypothetical protein
MAGERDGCLVLRSNGTPDLDTGRLLQ